MPKYYCDYCDTYLTHDSPTVRKTHIKGRKHKDNVKIYYQQWMEEQAQHLIDATTAAYKAGMIRRNGVLTPAPNMRQPAPLMSMHPGFIMPSGQMSMGAPPMMSMPQMMPMMQPPMGQMPMMPPMPPPMPPMTPPMPPPMPPMTPPMSPNMEPPMMSYPNEPDQKLNR